MTDTLTHRSPEAGTRLPDRTFTITRHDLVRYAGASGDFNPIHWNDRSAQRIGLSGVVAHGVLTMGLAVRALEDWAGPHAVVVDYRAAFAQPITVPDDDTGVTVVVSGTVTDVQWPDRVRVRMTAHLGTTKVLTRSYAVLAMRAG
ncbi:MaoC/PaaZ C-terminal domain-containing protein [Lentzea aerocolonigenes]|uniref:MaoC/PaaZ C-terminal domain-containing protein n=1 Tax=Lentzea aerocolonigenes TaxID=68170 RepID=UPI0004C45E50|nr:MaoC/PaaZ C-terminal domain-containing protein [Lentzea aerocolonigenes]MCP2248798.1 Acyl dehydratase [Lentzea aerocolonigenes]